MRLATALALFVALSAAAPGPRITPIEWQMSGRMTQGGALFGTAPIGTTRVTVDGVAVRLTGDRRFVAGFGRDAPAQSTVVATFADGSTDARTVAVTPRTYEIESIPSLKQAPPDAPPDLVYEALRKSETEAIAAARMGQSDETGWTQAFIWPAEGRISGVYGSQRILGGVPKAPHLGTDVAAPTGTPILAPAAGTVRIAGRKFSLEGNLVMLDHGHGLVSAFLHLSRVDVVPGQHVERGERIGAVGMTGRATGPHLHWALSWDEVKLDPALFVPPMPEKSAS